MTNHTNLGLSWGKLGGKIRWRVMFALLGQTKDNRYSWSRIISRIPWLDCLSASICLLLCCCKGVVGGRLLLRRNPNQSISEFQELIQERSYKNVHTKIHTIVKPCLLVKSLTFKRWNASRRRASRKCRPNWDVELSWGDVRRPVARMKATQKPTLLEESISPSFRGCTNVFC